MTGKVWHAYLKRGGNTTYVGMVSGKEKRAYPYPNENFERVMWLLRKEYPDIRTNLDKDKTEFDEWVLEDCRNLAEELYRKDFCEMSEEEKAAISDENKQFEKWMNSITAPHANFILRGGKYYVGIREKRANSVRVIDKPAQEALEEIRNSLSGVITNFDEGLTTWDRTELKKCELQAVKQWKIDCDCGYQVNKGAER